MFTPAFDEFLRKAGLAPLDLVTKWGITESHISMMRSGRRDVSPTTQETLVRALGIASPEAILWPANAVERAA